MFRVRNWLTMHSGTEGLQTHRWRKMDSNFQYAGAVKLVG